MKSDTMKIGNGKIPKILLMGNGINRAYGFASWESLIEKIAIKELSEEEKESLKSVPYPLQPVILTNDRLETQMKGRAEALSNLRASAEQENLLRKFATLSVDAIMTANYTYELEKALVPDFYCTPGRKCGWRKRAYEQDGQYVTQQLNTYFLLEDNLPPVWHIHGEAAKPQTMVLGHYHYGKLLAKMQQYVSSFISRYKTRSSKGLNVAVRSWLDYFMVSDIYIIGLGMSMSEMDLWWLVNCKKRHFPDRKVILFKPDIKVEERLLAEAYGVIVNADGFVGDFQAYYNWLHTELTRIL